jgi:hypothetical protein
MALSPLLLTVYAPPLVPGDDRTDIVIHAMEHALPGLTLAWTISDEGLFIPRRRNALANLDDEGMPVLCNGDEAHFVTLTGWETPAGVSSGRQPQFEFHAKWPTDAAGTTSAVQVLSGISEGARAFWGHVTPDGAALDIARQTSPTLEGPPNPPRGLPALKLPEAVASPEIPHRLGWLNYWSAATAQALGFPDPSQDAELLSRSRRTTSGGWLVPLTDSPLDLDVPAHLDALLRAYARFPSIGGRAPFAVASPSR